MVETTKEERAAYLLPSADGLTSAFGRALCRDVNACVEALEAEHALKEPHVPTVACHICAVLAESATPAATGS